MDINGAHGPGYALAADGLVACHECDALHRLHPLDDGQRAHCTRCASVLYRHCPASGLDTVIALALTAALLFVIANVFPFIALEIQGRGQSNLVVSGIIALFHAGQPGLAVLVAVTSVVFPGITIFGMLWVLVPARFGIRAPGAAAIFHLIRRLGPWTLLGVFMLSVIAAFVKLGDLATVIPGVSMFAFAGLMLICAAASARFDAALLWPPAGPRLPLPRPGATARELGLVRCHTCTVLVPHTASGCHRCGAALPPFRKTASVARTWALVTAAALLAIPANVYPVMSVIRFGRGEPSTIMSGVIQLLEGGFLGLAFIIFFASIVVPLLKIAALVYLLLSVQRRSKWRPQERLRLYRITEVVGAWSMVDIFLVGILSALVQLQALAAIEPGIGASFFGALVVVTMFAAQNFDPRLIWDHAKDTA
ncbi:MAG: paraquat-inducible membrane protein A [Gammaproteobacteria bacterium]|nr:paraquat-inducible membrane protein A [Gammaproteobacteria bacterium]